MNTSNLVCVSRLVGKGNRWVSAAGRTDLTNGEVAKVGTFNSFTVNSGPSNSHAVTCYLPVNTTDRVVRSCVVRFIGKSDEFVTSAGRFDLTDGELLVFGFAVVDGHVKDGPSGSNSVPVMRFTHELSRGKYFASSAAANLVDVTEPESASELMVA